MAVAVTPNSVRALIDTSLTAEQLPDATVNLPAYAGRAVLDVKARDSDWESRTGDEETRLNIAADNLCAAYLVRKMPWLLGEDQGTAGGYRRQETDVDALIADLTSTASEQIGAVVSEGEDGAVRPTFFTTARGGRGR